MKKLIAMLLALVMVLGLVACGSEKPAETKAPDAGTQAPATEAPAAAPASNGMGSLLIGIVIGAAAAVAFFLLKKKK